VALQQAMYRAVEAAVEALQPDISAVQVQCSLHTLTSVGTALVLRWCRIGTAMVPHWYCRL
jgi:hypothetical protein